MKLWMPIAAISVGLIYTALKLFVRHGFASVEVNRFVSFWLIVSYIFLIAFDTAEKKQTISMLLQTMLGALTAVAAMFLIGATAEQLAIAALIGTLLGWTADLWAKHIT
jgi:riboflavin transporter FmnP